jgi:hypothetical protein
MFGYNQLVIPNLYLLSYRPKPEKMGSQHSSEIGLGRKREDKSFCSARTRFELPRRFSSILVVLTKFLVNF